MAFAAASNCKLSDLRSITDGNGYNSSGSTSQTKLRVNCANSSSATNVRMRDSFFPGSRTLTIAGPGRQNDAFFVLPHTNTQAETSQLVGTLTWGTAGTYFTARCLNLNSSNLGAKWQLNRLSGNDTISWTNGNGTATQQTFNVTPGGGVGTSNGASTDFMEMKQVVQANTCWERYFCNTIGNNSHVTSESNANGTLTVYDNSGGGF